MKSPICRIDNIGLHKSYIGRKQRSSWFQKCSYFCHKPIHCEAIAVHACKTLLKKVRKMITNYDPRVPKNGGMVTVKRSIDGVMMAKFTEKQSDFNFLVIMYIIYLQKALRWEEIPPNYLVILLRANWDQLRNRDIQQQETKQSQIY